MRLGAYTIVADYHTHTRHSHGRGTVLDNVRAARSRGLKEIAITDHGPANLFGIGVASLSAFLTSFDKRSLQRVSGILISRCSWRRSRCCLRGGGDRHPGYLQEAFDILLVGLHPLVSGVRGEGRLPRAGHNLVASPHRKGRAAVRERSTPLRSSTLSCETGACGHPSGVPIAYRHTGAGASLREDGVRHGDQRRARAYDSRVHSDHRRAPKGRRFVLGSDAHSPDRVGDLAKAASLAQEAGLKAEEIVNARP